MPKIDSFNNEHAFLSNFFPVTVYFEGFAYPSSEHAYVASKTTDETIRRIIAKIPTAGEVKKYGKKIKLRKNFNYQRLELMYEIVYSKFSRNQELKKLLLDTGDAELIEGNWWGDVFWGVCDGVGQNHLGQILMIVRKELRG